MEKETPTEIASASRVSRREGWLLGCILLLSAAVRLIDLTSVHVEHFDEGVYASNRWFTAEEGARFPDRHLYAPPLWPAVLEISQLILGPSSWGVLLPGLCCGVLSLFLFWRLLREWTDPDSALVMTGVLAVSGFHILFSRTALTDVPVTLLILWGLLIGWRAISTERIGIAVGAGIISGLAWSVKYNGWYPLAVTGAGLAAANLFHVKQGGLDFKRWRCWLVMLVMASVVWIPSWSDLQQEARGGYAAVAANHAGYMDGWSLWLTNFRHQFANLGWYDDHTTLTMLFVILGLLQLTQRTEGVGSANSLQRLAFQSLGSRVRSFPYLILVVLLFAVCRGSLPMVWLTLALFGMGAKLVELVRAAWHRELLTPQLLSGWMLLAWVSSLLLVTPRYHPYPRLVLPLYLALLVGSAFGFQAIKSLIAPDTQSAEDQTAEDQRRTGQAARRARLLSMVGVCACLILSFVLVGASQPQASRGSAWESRLSMEAVSQQIVTECDRAAAGRSREPIAYLIYVYSEPAIYYHLCRWAPENVIIAPVANLGFLAKPPGREPVPIFLVTGPHAERNESYQQEREQAGGRLQLLEQIELATSDLLSLNTHSPSELGRKGAFPKATFDLSVMTLPGLSPDSDRKSVP